MSDPPSAAGKPWEGMDWRDEGTQQWRDSLTDEQYDEWCDWQKAMERWETDQAVEGTPMPEPTPPQKRVVIEDTDGNPLSALHVDQPIQIRVELPGAKPGEPREPIDVEIAGESDNETLTLKWHHTDYDGVAVYVSEPLTFAKGGEGGDSISIGGIFEFATGGLDGLETRDAELISVSHDGARTAAQVFDSALKLELAAIDAAIGEAVHYYTTLLINLRDVEADLAASPDFEGKSDVQKLIDDFQADAENHIALAHRAKEHFNNPNYLEIQKVEVMRTYVRMLGLDRPESAPPAELMTTWDKREENAAVHNAVEHAGELGTRAMWRGIRDATLGGYRLLASATLVAQIRTLATGETEMGTHATPLEWWLSLVDLVVQGASMGAMVKWNWDTTVGSTTPRVIRRQGLQEGVDPKQAPPGTVLNPNQVGMLTPAGRQAQLVARKHDVVIQVRPTNLDAMGPRATGAAPKPEALKSKTLNEIDELIGGPQDRRGCVGLFEPRLPERGTFTDAQWADITKRFKLRNDEWNGPIGQKQRALVEKGEFGIDGGVMTTRDGRPIAGDYDLFEISYRDGTPVPQNVYDAIVDELRSGPFEAAHGAHMRWDPQQGAYLKKIGTAGIQTAEDAVKAWRSDRNIYEGIVERHQQRFVDEAGDFKQGEALITFAPNSPPVALYAGQAVGPKFAALPQFAGGAAATGPSIVVNPGWIIGLASTQELVDGTAPSGPGWEWTQQWDWSHELRRWEEAELDITGNPDAVELTTVTKRGTNEWRGSSRYYLEDLDDEQAVAPSGRSWLKPAAAAAGALVLLGGGLVALRGGGGETTEAVPPAAAALPDAWLTPAGLAGAAGGMPSADGRGDYIYSVPGTKPGATHADVDILRSGGGTLRVDLPQANRLFNQSVYECGTATVRCADAPRRVPAGPLAVVSVTLAAAPGSGGANEYVYGFVFDRDGSAANNFAYQPPFEWDFFRDTDRWYQLKRSFDEWTLEASDWGGSAASPVGTAARVLVAGKTLVWVVPMAELGPKAAWRVTAFRHDGSFTPEVSAGDVSGKDPTEAPRPLAP